jgi:type I restriction enzyme S subunit
MRTKNVQADLDLSDVWAVSSALVPRADQLLRCGDILVSSANSWSLVGKCSWVPELPYAASFGGFVAVLRATSDKLDSRYLYRWFSSTRTQALVRSFGRQTTNISNLDIQRCADLEISLPPLPEQRRIAAILDQGDALRAKRREALAQLDSLTQSIFIEMFGDPWSNPLGWPQACLSELMQSGPQNGLYKPSTDYGTGTPILRIDAFYDGAVTKLANLKRVRVSAEEAQVFGLAAGDVVINRVNSIEYLGKSALIPALQEATVFESNMMRFRVAPERVLPIYVVAFLQTPFIKEQIRAASKDAVNQSSINQQDVKAFKINVPSLACQQSEPHRVSRRLFGLSQTGVV